MLKGTVWHFNSTIDTTSIWNSLPFTNMDGLFTCDGVQYKQLMGEELIDEQGTKPGSIDYINPDLHDGEMVYIIDSDIGGNVGWQNEAFRTIAFINEPVANGSALEAWLNENAVISADPYASYVVTGTALSSIADAIRAKTGDSSELTFPTGFVDAIESIRGLKELTADANATAEYIHVNKTAYVNGEKITGTGKIIRIRQVTKSWPSTPTTVPAGGCIKQSLLFQGADTSSMKGVDTITTTATSSLSSLAEFSYNQNTYSGVRRINMFFNNLTNNSIYVPSYEFTSIAKIIY